MKNGFIILAEFFSRSDPIIAIPGEGKPRPPLAQLPWQLSGSVGLPGLYQFWKISISLQPFQKINMRADGTGPFLEKKGLHGGMAMRRRAAPVGMKGSPDA
jgi:hypothetical protein